MTDNDIIKALECCRKPVGQACKECPLNSKGVDCLDFDIDELVLDLINRQKAEIKALNTENKQLQSDVITANQYYEHTKEQLEKAIKISQSLNQRFKKAKKELQNSKSELERFKEECSCLGCENEWLKAHYERGKAEAVKEFAERLKKEMSFGRYIQADQIDNLVKEMVGEG